MKKAEIMPQIFSFLSFAFVSKAKWSDGFSLCNKFRAPIYCLTLLRVILLTYDYE